MTDSLHNLPHPLLAPVIELTRLAGEVILPFWRANVTVTTKTDDSPVTAADLAAHQVLVEACRRLTRTFTCSPKRTRISPQRAGRLGALVAGRSAGRHQGVHLRQ